MADAKDFQHTTSEEDQDMLAMAQQNSDANDPKKHSILNEEEQGNYCRCGAQKEQFWNVDSLQFEWYCEQCGATLEVDEKW